MTDFFAITQNIVQRAYDHFPQKKDQVAFYFEGSKITYQQMLQEMESLGQQLYGKNLRKGDSVLILLPLGKELIFILLGLMQMGIIPVLIDPRLNKKLWKTMITRSKSKLIISHPTLIKWHWLLPWTWKYRFCSVNKKIFSHDVISVNEAPPVLQVSSFKPLITMNPEDIIIKTLTSGTTGEPKIIERRFSVLESQQRLSCKYLPALSSDIHLSLYGIGILQSFIHGSTTVIANSFQSDKIFQEIIKYNVTRLSIPPGTLYELINYCEQNRLLLPSLKCILTGGAPIPFWFRKKILSFFPQADCYIVFGSTECEPISKLHVNSFQERGIIGYPVGTPISELKIIKKKITTLQNQDIYEISLQGENCASLNEQGVLALGDLASFDSDGNLWLLGRNSEVIQGIPAAFIEEQIERIRGIKRSLFLRDSETNILFIEFLDNHEEAPLTLKDRVKIEALFTDLGLSPVSIFRVQKLPVDPRHLWKLQRHHVSSLLTKYCHDKMN